ncbi:MAG: capsule assembly Wzi family protein [Steroidobacteraceae bacterium]
MKKILVLLGAACCASLSTPVWSRGVSPYLPLNMSPAIERQIERVLVLAGKPVMRRPIPAAVVLDALPAACAIDTVLCETVERYLKLYTRDAGITSLQVDLGVSSGNSDRVIPNAHGRKAGSIWQVAGAAFYQPNDYLLFNAGGIAYEGHATPTGSIFSAGFDFAQLDVGFRDHWLSPLTDSSLLISTEAATMPSVTLSNYAPIGILGINYEIFLAEMSRQDGIAYFNTVTSGKPRLAGLQLGIEPVVGYSIALNRVMQYGGGARNGGKLSDLKEALFTNSNRPDLTGQSQEFGNQVASITSSIVFPGKVPFAARMEYAGEDNSYDGNKRLGDTALSLGIDFPKLGERYDLSYEISEWQNVWYTHHLYPKGLTNYGHVIGHWFGDQRAFGDRKGGRSHSLQVGWQTDSGDYWRATYRTLALQESVSFEIVPPVSYRHLHELGLRYTTSWNGHTIGAELSGGRDVFGGTFAGIAATFDLAKSSGFSASTPAPRAIADSDADSDVFLDVGINSSRVYQLLSWLYPNQWTPTRVDYHVGVGARRAVSEHSDLGVRLEFDGVDRRALLSVRALDYRYRFNRSIAASTFFGVGRYQFGAPAFGYYWGGGLQWMNVLPKWDVGLDLRHYDKLSRNRVLPNDPPYTIERPRIHFDIKGYAVYASRRF